MAFSLAQDVRPFPTKDDVRKAINTTGKAEIYCEHHEVVWRSICFIASRDDQNTLVARLANDGYLYIQDDAMVVAQLEKTERSSPSRTT
jgi:hypothetical protein